MSGDAPPDRIPFGDLRMRPVLIVITTRTKRCQHAENSAPYHASTKGLYNPADAGSVVVGVRLAVARWLEALMREDHPIDRLVAKVEGTVPASVADSMQILSQQLTSRRQWVLGPPELFDE